MRKEKEMAIKEWFEVKNLFLPSKQTLYEITEAVKSYTTEFIRSEIRYMKEQASVVERHTHRL